MSKPTHFGLNPWLPSRSYTRPSPLGPLREESADCTTLHALDGLPPERFQGPLRLLRHLMPDPAPPLTFEDCPVDPLTGAPVMGEPEPIDDTLTTWLGPDGR